jgi:peptidoglycan LD-endopeptidase LytH
MPRKKVLFIFACLGVMSVAFAVITYTSLIAPDSDSNDWLQQWFNEPVVRDQLTTENQQPCPDAPFILPSAGFIGLLYADPARPYNGWRRHTGIDVFGDGPPGEVPIVAVYDGYLTRLDDWQSTVIIRHDDPLQPGRTIWTYYTHMASEDGTRSYVADAFPPGTDSVFVTQGTVLGYQGLYNGSGPPIGLHVHMSIVESNADGTFKNEAILSNTLDPSPYFGLPLNINQTPDRPIRCEEDA